MKAILTLLFVLFIGVAAQAQSSVVDIKEEVKVETMVMGIVTTTQTKEVVTEKNTEVARLYKFKNSRIKKALKFTTKRNKAKMA
ncbi:hypothetical protein FEE95_19820 [Maribacter algarum]|uniref:Uncharacterized protein n=1 Tax=Maribacter algarum (ex Zhang et al. 2020) TaxID=2578118 RepID=A0A5S3PM15_9FLAO|nr:hypothetical protein [Maribacter algarum]TMM53314.1 hypothetical protein FEE95_19820 [Maribacter algarum]